MIKFLEYLVSKKYYSILLLLFINSFLFCNKIYSSYRKDNKFTNVNNISRKIKNQKFNALITSPNKLLAEINWEELDIKRNNIIWKDYKVNKSKDKEVLSEPVNNIETNIINIGSLNRSIVFNDKVIGPDISWLVPPGLKWNKRYKFDGSIRGHNRRKKNERFLGWNGGDAVGQFYYQMFNNDLYSLGFNLGVRSVYKGDAAGGGTSIGEGLSAGFRYDYSLSNSSGVALGAEQLLHFDGVTDTGRDIYLTVSKGWLRKNKDGSFPIDIATFGLATGKMGEGTIKGLCSELFGGSGTEVAAQRPLCWAPVFSLARVFDHRLSTFFEYNSYWFLVGSSISPFKEIPLRGTFAIQISDHIHNYKVNNFNELKWIFRLSLGF